MRCRAKEQEYESCLSAICRIIRMIFFEWPLQDLLVYYSIFSFPFGREKKKTFSYVCSHSINKFSIDRFWFGLMWAELCCRPKELSDWRTYSRDSNILSADRTHIFMQVNKMRIIKAWRKSVKTKKKKKKCQIHKHFTWRLCRKNVRKSASSEPRATHMCLICLRLAKQKRPIRCSLLFLSSFVHCIRTCTASMFVYTFSIFRMYVHLQSQQWIQYIWPPSLPANECRQSCDGNIAHRMRLLIFNEQIWYRFGNGIPNMARCLLRLYTIFGYGRCTNRHRFQVERILTRRKISFGIVQRNISSISTAQVDNWKRVLLAVVK